MTVTAAPPTVGSAPERPHRRRRPVRDVPGLLLLLLVLSFKPSGLFGKLTIKKV